MGLFLRIYQKVTVPGETPMEFVQHCTVNNFEPWGLTAHKVQTFMSSYGIKVLTSQSFF